MIALFFTYKDMKNIKRQNGGLLINTLKKEKTNIHTSSLRLALTQSTLK